MKRIVGYSNKLVECIVSSRTSTVKQLSDLGMRAYWEIVMANSEDWHCMVMSPLSKDSREEHGYKQAFPAILLLLFVLMSPAFLFGQHDPGSQSDPYFDPYDVRYGPRPNDTSHEHGIDHVNTTTGHLTVDIPLMTYPQRGDKLKLAFGLHYEMGGDPDAANASSALCVYASTTVQVCEWNQGGWYLADYGNLSAALQYNSVFPLTSSQVTYTGPLSLRVLEPTGSAHPMAYTGTGYESIDATGLKFLASGTTGANSTFAIKTVDGESLSPSTDTLCAYAAIAHADINCEAPMRQDTNGNLIAYTPQSGWTDTIGRRIPTPISAPSASCPSGPYPIIQALQWNFPGLGSGIYPVLICYIEWSGGPHRDLSTVEGFPHFPSWGAKIQSIVLPDNTHWDFIYEIQLSGNAFVLDTASGPGNLVQINLPEGGQIQYSWIENCGTPDNSTQLYCDPIVQSRQENANDGTGWHKWTYDYSWIDHPLGGVPLQITVTDPSGNDMVNTMTSSVLNTLTNTYALAPGWLNTGSDYYQGTGTSRTLLKSVQKTYSGSGVYCLGFKDCNSARVSTTYVSQQQVVMNITLSSETTTFGNNVGQKSYLYDSGLCFHNVTGDSCVASTFGRLTSKSEYNWGQGARGTLLRVTNIAYRWGDGSGTAASYLAAHLLDLKSKIAVTDSSGTWASETDYGYDESNGSPSGVRGNLTSTTRLLGGSASSPKSQTVYSAQGTPVQTIDANGNIAYITPDSTGLFPKQIQYPATNGVQHIEGFNYDANTGLLNSHTDENSQVAQYTYNDPLLRVTQVQHAVNTPAESWTSYAYPSNTQSTIAQDEYTNGDGAITKSISYDGFARPIQTQLSSDPSGTVFLDTAYDQLGRVYRVSNPYRSVPDLTNGATIYTYDALGRKTIQQNPDGSLNQWCYDGIATTGQTNCRAHIAGSTGEWVDFADELGNDRQFTSDALGRLTNVIEPNGTSSYASEQSHLFCCARL